MADVKEGNGGWIMYHRRLWCLPVKSATVPKESDSLKAWKGLPTNSFGTLSFVGPQPVGLTLTSSLKGSADAAAISAKQKMSQEYCLYTRFIKIIMCLNTPAFRLKRMWSPMEVLPALDSTTPALVTGHVQKVKFEGLRKKNGATPCGFFSFFFK